MVSTVELLGTDHSNILAGSGNILNLAIKVVAREAPWSRQSSCSVSHFQMPRVDTLLYGQVMSPKKKEQPGQGCSCWVT